MVPGSPIRQLARWGFFICLGRRPEEVIARIAAGELTAAELTQPHLVALAQAFSSLEDSARDALLQLVLRHWTIREIANWRELYAEGCGLRHCVASYKSSCISGKSAIWSFGLLLENGRRKHVLTVEVALPGRAICQVRGKANRLPTEREMEILHRWSA